MAANNPFGKNFKQKNGNSNANNDSAVQKNHVKYGVLTQRIEKLRTELANIAKARRDVIAQAKLEIAPNITRVKNSNAVTLTILEETRKEQNAGNETLQRLQQEAAEVEGPLENEKERSRKIKAAKKDLDAIKVALAARVKENTATVANSQSTMAAATATTVTSKANHKKKKKRKPKNADPKTPEKESGATKPIMSKSEEEAFCERYRQDCILDLAKQLLKKKDTLNWHNGVNIILKGMGYTLGSISFEGRWFTTLEEQLKGNIPNIKLEQISPAKNFHRVHIYTTDANGQKIFKDIKNETYIIANINDLGLAELQVMTEAEVTDLKLAVEEKAYRTNKMIKPSTVPDTPSAETAANITATSHLAISHSTTTSSVAAADTTKVNIEPMYQEAYGIVKYLESIGAVHTDFVTGLLLKRENPHHPFNLESLANYLSIYYKAKMAESAAKASETTLMPDHDISFEVELFGSFNLLVIQEKKRAFEFKRKVLESFCGKNSEVELLEPVKEILKWMIATNGNIENSKTFEARSKIAFEYLSCLRSNFFGLKADGKPSSNSPYYAYTREEQNTFIEAICKQLPCKSDPAWNKGMNLLFSNAIENEGNIRLDKSLSDVLATMLRAESFITTWAYFKPDYQMLNINKASVGKIDRERILGGRPVKIIPMKNGKMEYILLAAAQYEKSGALLTNPAIESQSQMYSATATSSAVVATETNSASHAKSGIAPPSRNEENPYVESEKNLRSWWLTAQWVQPSSSQALGGFLCKDIIEARKVYQWLEDLSLLPTMSNHNRRNTFIPMSDNDRLTLDHYMQELYPLHTVSAATSASASAAATAKTTGATNPVPTNSAASSSAATASDMQPTDREYINNIMREAGRTLSFSKQSPDGAAFQVFGGKSASKATLDRIKAAINYASAADSGTAKNDSKKNDKKK